MLELIVDYREKKILKILKDLEEKKKLVAISSNLDLGDIIFKLTNDKTNKCEYELIIERKEINDLISSIKDNRYKEQKLRCLSQISSHKHKTELIYLIESSSDNIRNPRDIKMYHGSIISMLLRDNIKLLFSTNIEETCKIIERLYSRLSSKPKEFIGCNLSLKSESYDDINNNIGNSVDVNNENTNDTTNDTDIKSINITLQRGGADYLLSRIKKKKSDNISANNCGVLMLTYVPNVSLHIAGEILKHYNNKISELIKYITNSEVEENEKIKIMATKKIKTVSGKERNLGPAIAKILIEYLK
jgi:ERCC4-type nuclease